MKPAFNVKSARLDALAVHLHGSDIDFIRDTLQSNIEKYIKFKALPFVLDISLVDSPQALPLGEIIALFALYEINIVALRHPDSALSDLALQNELSFVSTQRTELPVDFDVETVEDENVSEDDVAKSVEAGEHKIVDNEDTLYNDNDAVKTVEMAKQADLIETVSTESKEATLLDDTEENTSDGRVSMTGAKPTIVVSTPVRTGQQIYAEQADLIVLGSVSPGAEVIADGNIHIYAPLRGRALAGASGDSNARIFVQSMQAELVSIAGIYRVFEQSLPQHLHRKPVQIELQGDRLAIGAIHID